MIDLHGAPGSQNGFDNSGRRGGVGWAQGDTITQTMNALNKLAADYSAHPAVAMIEAINEPMGPAIGMGTIESFYGEAYNTLNTNGVAVTFHDAFLTPQAFNEVLPGLPNIVMDTHHYEVFDAGQLAMSPSAHVGSACAFGAAMATDTKWTISGEWTSAQTDCAKWLNGLGVGARYDGTFNYNGVGSSYIGSCAGLDVGTVDALPAAYKTSLAQFTEAQFDAYEKAAGWIYWTWKTESAPEWHFQNLTAAGIIPQPLTKRNFPGQCA
jgi:glucan 1,3-beta-glucosidase